MRRISQASPVGDSSFSGMSNFSGTTPKQSHAGTPSVQRTRFFIAHNSSTRLEDSYDISPTPLGEGGFGSVWKARLRGVDDVVRAVKAVPKSNLKVEELVKQEVLILRALDHPHICRLFETFESKRIVYLVMEHVDGQELFEYINGVATAAKAGVVGDGNFARSVGRQVFSALRYCHDRSVVHRDLKPENIMVKHPAPGRQAWEVEVKLIDFGLATLWSRSASTPWSQWPRRKQTLVRRRNLDSAD